MNGDGAWFGRRGYGTRNLPISWQGWLATLLYAVGVMLCFFLPPFWNLAHAELVAFAGFGLVTFAFGMVCARKSRPG